MRKLLTLLILLSSTSMSEAAPLVCMTKAEAQARWPKAWLYWHTKDRCWDNTPNKNKKFYWVVVPLSPKDGLTR
jgi:hypothetical protein